MQKSNEDDLQEIAHDQGFSQRSNRNLTEKRRRDRFNVLVYELAGIVSPQSGRKLDKITALELALNFFRDHRVASVSSQNTSSTSWQPTFTTDGEFNLIVTDALDCFILAVERDGNIIFASQNVLSLLGYLSKDILGTSLFSYVHDDDSLSLWSQLALMFDRKEMPALFENATFRFRMNCGGFYSRHSYQVINCTGAVLRQTSSNTAHEAPHYVVLVGKVEHPQPNRIVITADCALKEFSCRFSMDWKYIYIDHRAPSIIGFLPFEVLGTSVYEYCEPEDLFNIAQYHKFLVCLGKVTTCFYRHITKGQSWVWLRSCCYISYNQWNSKPEAITCTTSVATFDEVCANQAEILQHDKDRFTKIISKSGSDTLSSIPSWTASPPHTPGEPTEQEEVHSSKFQEQTNPLFKHTSTKRVLSSDFLSRVLQTPSEQLMDILNTEDDVEMESDDDNNEALLWLESLTIPSGLTSSQITTHLKLQEEYRKIAEQIIKQERQLKVIRKLIEYSRLLLDLGMNLEESFAGSEPSSAPSGEVQ